MNRRLLGAHAIAVGKSTSRTNTDWPLGPVGGATAAAAQERAWALAADEGGAEAVVDGAGCELAGDDAGAGVACGLSFR